MIKCQFKKERNKITIQNIYEVMPLVLLCRSKISELNVGGMTVEFETLPPPQLTHNVYFCFITNS